MLIPPIRHRRFDDDPPDRGTSLKIIAASGGKNMKAGAALTAFQTEAGPVTTALSHQQAIALQSDKHAKRHLFQLIGVRNGRHPCFHRGREANLPRYHIAGNLHRQDSGNGKLSIDTDSSR